MFIQDLFRDAQPESDSDVAGCEKWFGGGRSRFRIEIFTPIGEFDANGRRTIVVGCKSSRYGDCRLLWICLKAVEEKLEKCMGQARRVAGDRAFCDRWLLDDLRLFCDQRFCFFKGLVD